MKKKKKKKSRNKKVTRLKECLLLLLQLLYDKKKKLIPRMNKEKKEIKHHFETNKNMTMRLTVLHDLIIPHCLSVFFFSVSITLHSCPKRGNP